MNTELKNVLNTIGFIKKEEITIDNNDFYYTKSYFKNFCFVYTVDKFFTHGYFLSNGKDRYYISQHKLKLKENTNDNIKIVINDLKKTFPHKFRKSKTDSLL